MRLNFTNFHEISSEIVSFQIRSAPQFHQFSSKIAHFQIRNFVRNGQISNKERGVPCRVVPCRSPIRFFDPILNNALALRASQKRFWQASSRRKTQPRRRNQQTAAMQRGLRESYFAPLESNRKTMKSASGKRPPDKTHSAPEKKLSSRISCA